MGTRSKGRLWIPPEYGLPGAWVERQKCQANEYPRPPRTLVCHGRGWRIRRRKRIKRRRRERQ